MIKGVREDVSHKDIPALKNGSLLCIKGKLTLSDSEAPAGITAESPLSSSASSSQEAGGLVFPAFTTSWIIRKIIIKWVTSRSFMLILKPLPSYHVFQRNRNLEQSHSVYYFVLFIPLSVSPPMHQLETFCSSF